MAETKVPRANFELQILAEFYAKPPLTSREPLPSEPDLKGNLKDEMGTIPHRKQLLINQEISAKNDGLLMGGAGL